ncbi:uncharacterized protein LOC117341642 [Pecten maximus]|uniref:uncharacterized protein LOC117341642 n=1 Tax=Pecten maximus TaxID=6579 RepID=UPI0014586D3A|nr:uncharacterized protein LOC117341642 [Pecten maximus]
MMEKTWKLPCGQYGVVAFGLAVLVLILMYTLYTMNITIRMGELEKRNADLASKLETLQTSVDISDQKNKKQDEAIGNVKPTADKCAKHVIMLERRIEKIKITIEKFKPDIVRLDNAVTDFEGGLEKLTMRVFGIETLMDDVKDLWKTTERMHERFKEYRYKLYTTDMGIEELEDEIGKLKPTAVKCAKMVTKLEQRTEKINMTFEKLKPDVVRLDNAVTGFEGRLEKQTMRVSGIETLKVDVKDLWKNARGMHERLYHSEEYIWREAPKIERLTDDLKLVKQQQDTSTYVWILVIFVVILIFVNLYVTSYINKKLDRMRIQVLNRQVNQLEVERNAMARNPKEFRMIHYSFRLF